jgi:hypothetical protein
MPSPEEKPPHFLRARSGDLSRFGPGSGRATLFWFFRGKKPAAFKSKKEKKRASGPPKTTNQFLRTGFETRPLFLEERGFSLPAKRRIREYGPDYGQNNEYF